MKISLNQVILAHQSIAKLQESGINLPVSIGFKINRFLSQTLNDIENVNRQRVKLAEEAGAVPSEQEGFFRVPPEKQQWLNQELVKLLEVEINVDFEEKIPLSILDKFNCKLSDAAGLIPLVDDSK